MIVYTYRASCTRIVDADTLDLRVDLGLHCSIEIRARLVGVDAPERNTAEGQHATAWVGRWILDHPGPYTVRTERDRQERYGRWLATIEAPDGAILNEDLVIAGHARRYEG